MSAQANSLRAAFQKNEQMKKEMQHLRANLVMMRKNVIKKPRKNSALSDMGGKRAKLNMEEEKAEITAPEVGEVLALDFSYQATKDVIQLMILHLIDEASRLLLARVVKK